MGLQCPWYSLQSLRSCWESSMDFNGRQYKWQTTVLKEPRRGWYSVVSDSSVRRHTFRFYLLGNLPFPPSAPISLRSLSSPFMRPLAAAFPALSALSEWVTEALLHVPVSLSLNTTVHLGCAFPRRVSSGVYHVLVHPCSPGSWSTVSYCWWRLSMLLV